MNNDAPSKDPEQIRRFLDLVLETGQMNGAYVDTDLRHMWVHTPDSGPPEEEILGNTDEELFPEEVADSTMGLKREAIETKSHVEGEFAVTEPSGQSRYRAAAEPLYDDEGAVKGSMFAAADVSPKYEFLDRTTDAVYTVDSDWTVTFWNSKMAERTGIKPEEIVGKNLWDEYSDYIPSELGEQYRHVMESEKPAELEQYIPAPFDYWVEVRVFANDDGLSVFSRDISERKAHEEQLENQRDTLEVLNHVLTHDIRNDLQLVTAYTELLTEGLDDEAQRYADIIDKRANHAVELTKSASEITKVLFAEDEQLTRFSLRSVVNAELENIRSAYPDAAILMDGEIRDVVVVADDMLGSVFRNLLKNGIQHNNKPVPEVSVSTEERPDEVVIAVVDNGPGVSDTQKETIFGKGEKGLESSGTGIGLYLVNTLVERYGGEIRVADNDPEGAVFSVTLPKVPERRTNQ